MLPLGPAMRDGIPQWGKIAQWGLKHGQDSHVGMFYICSQLPSAPMGVAVVSCVQLFVRSTVGLSIPKLCPSLNSSRISDISLKFDVWDAQYHGAGTYWIWPCSPNFCTLQETSKFAMICSDQIWGMTLQLYSVRIADIGMIVGGVMHCTIWRSLFKMAMLGQCRLAFSEIGRLADGAMIIGASYCISPMTFDDQIYAALIRFISTWVYAYWYGTILLADEVTMQDLSHASMTYQIKIFIRSSVASGFCPLTMELWRNIYFWTNRLWDWSQIWWIHTLCHPPN